MKKILLSLGFLITSLILPLSMASATSPYACQNKWGNGNVCYQIVGSGSLVQFWSFTNSTTFASVHWWLYGPSGLWAQGNIAKGTTHYQIWDKNAIAGSWCAYFLPNVTGAFAKAEICEKVS